MGRPPRPLPGASPEARLAFQPETLVGLTLRSGTGEELGVVVDIEEDRWGRPKHLRFREPGSDELRRAPLRFIRSVHGGAVHMAGPREGYHIARLGPRA